MKFSEQDELWVPGGYDADEARTQRRMARLPRRIAVVQAANRASASPFDELAASGTCEDPAGHNLHTDGRWLFESCPACGGNEPLSRLDLLARADAERDFAAAVREQAPDGCCTACGARSSELVPWSGQRLCWACTDTQLDLMASAILADAPVSVGTRGLR